MNKMLKCLGSIALAVCIALGCFFIPKNLSKNQRFLETSLENAGAYSYVNNSDSGVTQFYTDNFSATRLPTSTNGTALPIAPADSNNYFVKYSFMFERYSNTLKIYTSVDYTSVSSSIRNSTDGYVQFARFDTNNSGSIPITNKVFSPAYITNSINTGFWVYASNYLLDLNFQYFIISNHTNYAYDFPTGYNSDAFIAYTFFDSFGDYVTIFVSYNGYTVEGFRYIFLNTGIYFLTDSAQFNNNDYYKQGFVNGRLDGIAQGQEEGYNNGFNQGNIEGYNNGYTDGLESSERLGFPALITAVIDVPVKVFTSLFNFDILGVNILTFITSLLTIALILAIVRKVKSD